MVSPPPQHWKGTYLMPTCTGLKNETYHLLTWYLGLFKCTYPNNNHIQIYWQVLVVEVPSTTWQQPAEYKYTTGTIFITAKASFMKVQFMGWHTVFSVIQPKIILIQVSDWKRENYESTGLPSMIYFEILTRNEKRRWEP